MDRIPTNRYVLFAALAVLGCAIDLLTKAWAFSWPALRSGDIHWWWTDHAGIQLSRNWGALFGMGQGMVWLFALLSIAAALAIPTWLFLFGAARDGWMTVALGCIMGGVLGNLYDRLGLSGEVWVPPGKQVEDPIHAVRDWILWQVNENWRWPNFNIADSLLVCGVGLLMLRAVLESAPKCGSSNGEEVS